MPSRLLGQCGKGRGAVTIPAGSKLCWGDDVWLKAVISSLDDRAVLVLLRWNQAIGSQSEAPSETFLCVHRVASFPLNVKGMLAGSHTAKRNFDLYNNTCLGCFVPMNSCMCISRRLLQLHCKWKCLPNISGTFSKVERQKYSPEDSVLFLTYVCVLFFGYVQESL